MDYYIREGLLKAIMFEAMYQCTKEYIKQSRDAWANDVGYDLSKACDKIWCDGYCQDEY